MPACFFSAWDWPGWTTHRQTRGHPGKCKLQHFPEAVNSERSEAPSAVVLGLCHNQSRPLGSQPWTLSFFPSLLTLRCTKPLKWEILSDGKHTRPNQGVGDYHYVEYKLGMRWGISHQKTVFFKFHSFFIVFLMTGMMLLTT